MDRHNYRVSVRRKDAQDPVDVIVEAPGAYQALQIAKIEYGAQAVVSEVATPVLEDDVKPTLPPQTMATKWTTRPGGPLALPIYALSDFIVAKAFGNVDPSTPRGRRITKLVTLAVCVSVLAAVFALLVVLRALRLIGQD